MAAENTALLPNPGNPEKRRGSKLKTLPVRVDLVHPALLHDPDDPRGVRAVQTLLKCQYCPFGVIMDKGTGETNYEDVAEQLAKLFRRMDKLNKAWFDLSSEEKLDDFLNNEVSTFQKMRDEEQREILKLDAERKKVAGLIMILVDMHGELNKSDIVVRGALKFRLKSHGNGDHHTSGLTKMWYLAFPCVVFFFAFGFQSFCLHIATHFYVRYMDMGPESRRKGGGVLFDVVGHYVGVFLAHTDPTGQGAVVEGNIHIPLTLLDCTAIVPLALCVMAHALAIFEERINIGLWNKTFIVASIAAIFKGVADAVTILPDSIGWDSCKDRLGESGLRHIRDMHWLQYGWNTVLSAIFSEIVGTDGGRRVRYCGDMMISGHTYFAAVFALSAYKQIWFMGKVFDRYTRLNMVVRRVTGFVCILCMLTEMALVAAARFHYTVDMLASVVLVLLLWDSTCVEQLAADWSEGFEYQASKKSDKKSDEKSSRTVSPESDEGPVEILPSQSSSLFNYRAHAGHSPWWEPDEFGSVEYDPKNECEADNNPA